MKNRKCYLFVFEGYADWEPALAVATLNKYSDFSIYTFSLDGSPVRSMGGVNVHPDTSLWDIDPDSVDLLILPGGEAWLQGQNEQIAPLVARLTKQKKTIAAICDGTIFMAKHGYLDDIWHTSNGPHYLPEKVPSYKGKLTYEDIPCVVDGNFITANGAGMIEFAVEIFRQQQILNQDMLEKFYDLYKSGGVNNRMYQ
jgi:putative intracellular protease/amidase